MKWSLRDDQSQIHALEMGRPKKVIQLIETAETSREVPEFRGIFLLELGKDHAENLLPEKMKKI